MIKSYLLGSLLVCWLIAKIEANPMPGAPIFYKTNTYPSICYLPPDSGACDTDEVRLKEGAKIQKQMDQKQETRYYFDTTTETCYPFGMFVKPCTQNKNNFKSIEKCKAYCQLV